MRLYLLFSHSLTPEQIRDARENWQVKEIIPLPEALQQLWSNVPAELPSLLDYLEPLWEWLRNHTQKNDRILIQGDYGATFLAVQFALENKLVPIYSTTTRKTTENQLPDGSIRMERIFVHQRFRKYEKIAFT